MKFIFLASQILFLLLLPGTSVHGQTTKKFGTITPWEIGFSSGASSFVTSINPRGIAPFKRINYWYNNMNPGIGLSIVRNFSPALGIEMNWLNTRLTGRWNNKWASLPVSVGRESPLTFNSSTNQLDLMFALNVNQMMLPGEYEDPWHLFLKVGIGITDIVDNKKFYAENHSTAMAFAVDAGFSFSLGERIKFRVGSKWHFVNTDNLDGVHLSSVDLNGATVEYQKIREVCNYNYLGVSYSLGNFKLKKLKIPIRNKKPGVFCKIKGNMKTMQISCINDQKMQLINDILCFAIL